MSNPNIVGIGADRLEEQGINARLANLGDPEAARLLARCLMRDPLRGLSSESSGDDNRLTLDEVALALQRMQEGVDRSMNG